MDALCCKTGSRFCEDDSETLDPDVRAFFRYVYRKAARDLGAVWFTDGLERGFQPVFLRGFLGRRNKDEMSFDTIHIRGGMVYEKCDTHRGLSFILGVALNRMMYFYPLDITPCVSSKWNFLHDTTPCIRENGMIYRYCIP